MSLKSMTTLRKRLQVSGGTPWKPSAIQKRGIKFLLQHGGAGLFLDPGVGKTSIILAAFLVLLLRGMTRGMLIIAPRRVARMVWTSADGETQKWNDFRGLSIGLLHGPHKDTVVQQKHDIYVMTPDGLEWLLFGKADPEDIEMPIGLRRKPGVTPWRILKDKVDILAVDETSKFRKTTSKRSVLIASILKFFIRRWGATGSPAPNGLLSLYGQVFVLDMGKALGPYFSFYRNTYFDKTGFQDRHWNLKEDGEDKIHKRLKNVAMRLEAGDYIKMPQRSEIDVLVELDPYAREVYDMLEADAIVQISKSKVAAFNAGGVMSKCQQVANGSVYVDEVVPGQRTKRKTVQVHIGKLEALLDLIDELQGQPLLIGVWFEHDVDTIRKALNKHVPYLGGTLSDKEAEKIKGQWNRGELTELLGHPQTMGHGLNMQENHSAHVAIYSIPLDYDLYDQFIRRVQRQGNNSNVVFVHRIIARGTVDEDAVRGLARKERTQSRLLAAVAAFTMARYKAKGLVRAKPPPQVRTRLLKK